MHLAALQTTEGGVMDFATRDGGANRDVAAPQRFGKCDNVGLETPVFTAEEAPGAPHPNLHFVADKECAVLTAQALGFRKEARGRDVDSLALDGFQDECSHISLA